MMKKSVWIHTLGILFSVCFVLHQNLYAAPNIKVAVIPFELAAEHPNPQMKTRIPSMIAEQIQAEDTGVELLENEIDIDLLTDEQLQKIGIQSGADYILTGAIFVAGEGISIDAQLFNVYEMTRSARIYADAEKLENLLSAVSSLSKSVIAHIYQKKVIIDVAVTGNRRVETDAILRLLDTQPGDIIQLDRISKDLQTIFEMGYFDDVVVRKKTLDHGTHVIFEVTEKSTVRMVKFRNNLVFEEDELFAVVNTRTGSILNIHNLNSDMERIRMLYAEKNYHNASISYEILPLENAQADIVFNIQEEDRVRVEKITFGGNQYFKDKALKKAIQTSEKGFFSFFTGSGILNDIEVKNDVIRIESLYKNNGFIDTKVSDPKIDIGKDLISIHFEFEEGKQYKIKSITFKGDLIVPEAELFEKIESRKGELYNREMIRKDVMAISDVYGNQGFANVDVVPLIDKDESDNTMQVSFAIEKGDPVYFNRVYISGNSKTRDKVIRRELKVIEQDVYSKENIEFSFRNLSRLDYFEDLEVKPVRTAEKDKMDLDVKVVEKATGSFSIGGGFSSMDGGFIVGGIEERNLFGNGQTIKLEAKLATESVLYNLSFFEPYILDTRVSGGFRLYKEEIEYDHYDKDALGFSVNVGYRLFDYTTIGANYGFEDYEIDNVNPLYTSMTQGSYFTSSITPFISYDSRNSRFMATEGQKHRLSVEYAGEFLGSDLDFTKYLAETGVYFPLFWKFSGALHAEAGYLDDRTNSTIDIDHIRFYLGGMNSVRGFDKYDIGGKRAGETRDIGGEKYVQFNAELSFPLTEKYKIAGIFFYDRGDVYRTSESIDLGDQFSSFGTGIRWNSPVGPLRVEYAWVIDGKNIKERGDGKVEFSVGASF